MDVGGSGGMAVRARRMPVEDMHSSQTRPTNKGHPNEPKPVKGKSKASEGEVGDMQWIQGGHGCIQPGNLTRSSALLQGKVALRSPPFVSTTACRYGDFLL